MSDEPNPGPAEHPDDHPDDHTDGPAPGGVPADAEGSVTIIRPSVSDPSASDPSGDTSEDAGSSAAAPAAPAAPRPLAPQPQAVRSALASLTVPSAEDEFWAQLDAEVEEGTPLHIAPRPAIRPITQPPPAAGAAGTPLDDVFERGGHRGPAFGPKEGVLTGNAPGMSRQRLLILAVVAVVVGLLALGAVLGGDDSGDDVLVDDEDAGTAADSDADADADGVDPEAAEDDEADEDDASEEDEAQPSPRGVEDDTVMQADGVGLLRTGSQTLADVSSVTGVELDVNERTFQHSGGRCFDALLPGADDLTLWLRSPDDQETDDPMAAVLSVITVSGWSARATEAGFGVGTTEDELREHFQLQLVDHPNPFNQQGAILVAPEESAPEEPPSGNAYAFVTGDDGRVLEVRLGHEPLLARPNVCQQ